MTVPLYWIDCFKEYDRTLFQKGMNIFKEVAVPVAKEQGFEVQFVEFESAIFGYDTSPHFIFEGKDLMVEKACVYIPYTNPHPQTEQLLHALARVVATSENWVLLNGDRNTLHIDKDKESALHFARQIDAETIPTWFVPERTLSRTQLKDIEKQLGPYPYILKPSSMLAGLGIIKVDTQEILCSLLDYVAQSPRSYLLQPFLHGAIDYRVYLEDYQIIACQKRTPPKGSFLANVSQSGKGEAISPSQKMAELSQQLARKIGRSYLCIDWLVTEHAIYFSEIDFAGMFFGLPEPERTRVAHALFRSARNKIEALDVT